MVLASSSMATSLAAASIPAPAAVSEAAPCTSSCVATELLAAAVESVADSVTGAEFWGGWLAVAGASCSAAGSRTSSAVTIVGNSSARRSHQKPRAASRANWIWPR